MITIKCLCKKYNKNGVITHYKIQDIYGKEMIVTAQQLREAMIKNQVQCVNLKLTSNNRIVDKKTSNNVSKGNKQQTRKTLDINKLLIKLQMLGGTIRKLDADTTEIVYNNAVYRVKNNVVYLHKVLLKNGTFEIPFFVSELDEQSIDGGIFSQCERIKVVNNSEITNMDCMFANCKMLIELDLSGFDTSKVTSMRSMFDECSSIDELDLSGFDTSKVTDMQGMFSGCWGLKKLDISSFRTHNVTNMSDMFAATDSLQSLDVSMFDTSKVTDMQRMFSYCAANVTGLENFKITNVHNVKNMFSNFATSTLDLRAWDFSNVDVTNIFYTLDNIVCLIRSIKFPKNKEKELKKDMFKTLVGFFCDIEDEYRMDACREIAPIVKEIGIQHWEGENDVVATVNSNDTMDIWYHDKQYHINLNTGNTEVKLCD